MTANWSLRVESAPKTKSPRLAYLGLRLAATAAAVALVVPTAAKEEFVSPFIGVCLAVGVLYLLARGVHEDGVLFSAVGGLDKAPTSEPTRLTLSRVRVFDSRLEIIPARRPSGAPLLTAPFNAVEQVTVRPYPVAFNLADVTILFIDGRTARFHCRRRRRLVETLQMLQRSERR